jgi:hypothetical protein
MKKVFLNIAILLVGLVSFSQVQTSKSINTNNLEGVWTSNDVDGYLLFYRTPEEELIVKEFEKKSNKEFNIIDFKIYKTYFVVKARFPETDWLTESKYTFIDELNLQCEITNPDGTYTIFYTKI